MSQLRLSTMLVGTQPVIQSINHPSKGLILQKKFVGDKLALTSENVTNIKIQYNVHYCSQTRIYSLYPLYDTLSQYITVYISDGSTLILPTNLRDFLSFYALFQFGFDIIKVATSGTVHEQSWTQLTWVSLRLK